MTAALLIGWPISPGAAQVAPVTSRPAVTAVPGTACADERLPSSRFEFRSSFWLNLHNFLVREARRAAGREDDGLLAAGNLDLPLPPLRAPSPAERERWDGAVNYYRTELLGAPLPDSVVIRVNNALALSVGPDLDGFRGNAALRDVLLGVAPLYRDLWWRTHDARNREWIADVQTRLDGLAPCLMTRLADTFGGLWPESPIPVEATVYASWAAAYTTFDPPHITVSTVAVGSQGLFGVELLLHEAGHTLMRPLEQAYARAAAERGREGDRMLVHLLLFYTAGDLVRRVAPDYPTAAEAFGVWRQNGRAARYRRLLEADWRPYLAGERPLDEAIAALAAAPRP